MNFNTFDLSLFIGQSYFNNDVAQLQMKCLNLLIQQIKVFLQKWYGRILE